MWQYPLDKAKIRGIMPGQRTKKQATAVFCFFVFSIMAHVQCSSFLHANFFKESLDMKKASLIKVLRLLRFVGLLAGLIERLLQAWIKKVTGAIVRLTNFLLALQKGRGKKPRKKT